MKRLYVIKKDFYDIVTKFPNVVLAYEQFDIKQVDLMLEQIRSNDIMESASISFQKSIIMEDCTLYMEPSFQQEANMIVCNLYYVLFDKDTNPFIELLKRKFRYHFIIDDEIGS